MLRSNWKTPCKNEAASAHRRHHSDDEGNKDDGHYERHRASHSVPGQPSLSAEELSPRANVARAILPRKRSGGASNQSYRRIASIKSVANGHNKPTNQSRTERNVVKNFALKFIFLGFFGFRLLFAKIPSETE